MAKYNEKELADTSKFLSFVLRHKPESIGIVLDREGWADIDKLILCAQKAGKRLTRALLDTVVATSDKKRFSYSSDGRCIRAVQGHSTSQVAISFAEKTPPQFLYHGTASRFLDEIKKQGLIAGERHYVHLSADEATARKVGARHGSPVILTVKAQEMAKRGLPFWQAENGVWLTSTVAVEFLEYCSCRLGYKNNKFKILQGLYRTDKRSGSGNVAFVISRKGYPRTRVSLITC